jgi:hypothetical protein
LKIFDSDITFWTAIFHKPFFGHAIGLVGSLLASVIDDSKVILDSSLRDEAIYAMNVAQQIWNQKIQQDSSKKDLVAVDLETKHVTSIFESIRDGISEYVANLRPLIEFFVQLESRYPEKTEKESIKLVSAFYDGVLSALVTKHDQLKNRLVLIDSEDLNVEKKVKKRVFVGRVAFYLSESLPGILESLRFNDTNESSYAPLESLQKLQGALFNVYLDSSSRILSLISAKEYFDRTLKETDWAVAGSTEIAANLSPYAAKYLFMLVRKFNQTLGMSVNDILISRIMATVNSELLTAFDEFLKLDEENVVRIHQSKATQLYLDFSILAKVTSSSTSIEQQELKREELSRRIMEFV